MTNNDHNTIRLLLSDNNFIIIYNTKPIGDGTEGNVYEYNNDLAIKLYKIKPSETRKLKLNAMCDLYRKYRANFINISAVPQELAFTIKNSRSDDLDYKHSTSESRVLSGYSMQYFHGDLLENVRYDLKNNKYNNNSFKNDDEAINFIISVYAALKYIHDINIILGDINEDNILVDTKNKHAFFLDFDSSRMSGFDDIESHTPGFHDPHLFKQGRLISNSSKYSMDSNYYSIACYCYELIVGISPFNIFTDPRPNDNRIKYFNDKNINFLMYFANNGMQINQHKLLDHVGNNMHRERLYELKTKYPLIYNYFVDIFVNDKRYSILEIIPINDTRNPSYFIYQNLISKTGFDIALREYIDMMIRLKKENAEKIAVPFIGTMASNKPKIIDSNTIIYHKPHHKSDNVSKYLESFIQMYNIDIDKMVVNE